MHYGMTLLYAALADSGICSQTNGFAAVVPYRSAPIC